MMTTSGELWHPIQGYGGFYEVSNLGRVRSLHRTVLTQTGPRTFSGRELSRSVGTEGYLNVCLSKDCVKASYDVHRLVAAAFLPNPNNLPEVNHKNRVKTDASVDNLEWISQEDNLDHYYESVS